MQQELGRLGGHLLAIAVDAPPDARRVAENNDLGFSILCDTKREVIRAYGLVHEGGGPGGSDIAIPAQILIDRDGNLVWRFISKRIQDRLHPDEVLAAVRRMAGAQQGATGGLPASAE